MNTDMKHWGGETKTQRKVHSLKGRQSTGEACYHFSEIILHAKTTRRSIKSKSAEESIQEGEKGADTLILSGIC